MSVMTTRSDYDEAVDDWQLVSDSLKESRIKKATVKYLPRTSGQASHYTKTNNDAPYQAYKLRARFPLIVNPAVTALTGVAHKYPGEIEVPQRFEQYLESITPDGENVEELSRQTVRKVLQHGRYGLLSDVDDMGMPYIAGYDARSIINWRTGMVGGREVVTLVVLAETRDVSTDEFVVDTETQYRVLRMEDGRYTSTVYDDAGEVIEQAEAMNSQGAGLDYIPFVFVGSMDLTPDIDESPILPLAKTAVSIYQLDADYRQSLHMTAEPTPYVIGATEVPTSIGSATIWGFANPETKVGYLEVSGNGIEAQRQEILDEYQRAAKSSGEIAQESGQESGEAIKMRMFNRHASLYSVVSTTGAGIEQALQYCADMIGINPDEITYTANMDFTGADISEQLINVLNTAVNAGNLPKEVLWQAVRSGGLTELEDAQIADSIEIGGMNGDIN